VGVAVVLTALAAAVRVVIELEQHLSTLRCHTQLLLVLVEAVQPVLQIKALTEVILYFHL
jgi:hypothetical protein